MTSPFAPAFEASLKQTITGGVLRLLGNHQVFPQYFCCLSGNTVGVDKDPVVIMIVSADVLCTFTPFTADISQSYSATSTLITYSVDFGDGNVVNGAWPPAGPIAHPLGGYQIPGTYDVVGSVVDLLGASGSATVQIEAVDCTPLMLPSEPIVGTDGEGVFYSTIHELNGAATVWAPMENVDLSVPGALYAYCLIEYEHADGNRSVYMGTRCGIYEYRYLPAGSGHWHRNITQIDIGAALGVLTPSFAVWHIEMCADMPEWGYARVGFGAPPPPIGTNYAAVISTRDGWQTIHDASIVSNLPGSSNYGEVAIAHHSGGSTLYCSVDRWLPNPSELWKSTNYGAPASWVQVDTAAFHDQGHVHVPYVNPGWTDLNVFWMLNGGGRYSTDAGASFANFPFNPLRSFGDTYNYHYSTEHLEWCTWQGGAPAPSRLFYCTTLAGGMVQFGPQWSPIAGNSARAQCVLDRSILTGLPTEWMWVGDDPGITAQSIKLNTGAAQTECAGNFAIVCPGGSSPFSIMKPWVEEYPCPACGV